MPVYNPILYVSAVATAVALIRENRTVPRHWAVPTVALAPVLAVAGRDEHHRAGVRGQIHQCGPTAVTVTAAAPASSEAARSTVASMPQSWSPSGSSKT
jgi:hypothetical protein